MIMIFFIKRSVPVQVSNRKEVKIKGEGKVKQQQQREKNYQS
jgi:hypothetical protein